MFGLNKTYKTSSEQELLSACKKNKRAAQHELYTRFSKTMYNTCLAYAKNSDVAQELLQDGFLKVFTNIEKFDGKGSLEGWIRRVMINTCIDYIRKIQPQFVSIDLKEFYSFKLKQFDYNSATKTHEKEHFLYLIQNLAPGYRTIMNLHYGENMTHEEIAKQLNITVGTSKSQLARGKFLLKKHLEEYLLKEKEVKYGS